MTQSQPLLRELIGSLRQRENQQLLEALAREINNHIFIRGTFTIGQGELTSEDMQIILARLQIVETTLALSERGQGPEAYAPKRRETVTHIDPKVLDGLENEFRTSRAKT